MTREDFKIVPRFYKTSSLTMIVLNDVIIESVEIYKNYKTVEDESSKKDATKPIKMKSLKEKRTEQEISAECERLIKKHIDTRV